MQSKLFVLTILCNKKRAKNKNNPVKIFEATYSKYKLTYQQKTTVTNAKVEV